MPEVDAQVVAAISERGVLRLTHFTNSKNLPHIIESGAILPTTTLLDGRKQFQRTDDERLDGRPDLICCNIDFPNMYYFFKTLSRPGTINFSDWVIFLIDPSVATREGVLFARGNAAKFGGAHLEPGVDGLARMYADSVYGWNRSGNHRGASPTDVQAELLIPGEIRMSEVIGIVVPDESAVRRERGRLSQVGRNPDPAPWFISEPMFQKGAVTNAVRASREIQLVGPWDTGEEE